MGFQATVEHEPDRTIPEDSILRAKAVEITPKHVDWTDPRTNLPAPFTRLIWWFQVTAPGQYEGRKVRAETDSKISDNPRNQFRGFAEALLGRELAEGVSINTDELLELPCDIAIGHEKDKKDPTKHWERVVGIFPLEGGFQLTDSPPF